LLCLAIVLCASSLSPIGANLTYGATGTITGHAADGQANSDGSVSNTAATYGRLGADAGVRHSVVQVFQIPSSILNDPTQQFSAATYTAKYGMGSSPAANGDLYVLSAELPSYKNAKIWS